MIMMGYYIIADVLFFFRHVIRLFLKICCERFGLKMEESSVSLFINFFVEW